MENICVKFNARNKFIQTAYIVAMFFYNFLINPLFSVELEHVSILEVDAQEVVVEDHDQHSIAISHISVPLALESLRLLSSISASSLQSIVENVLGCRLNFLNMSP